MFDFLKKKINDFVGVITRKEEKIAEAEQDRNEGQIEKRTEQIIAPVEDKPQTPIIAEPKITPQMEEELVREEKEEELAAFPEEKIMEKPIVEPKSMEMHIHEEKILEIKEVEPKKEAPFLEKIENIEPETPEQIAHEREKISEKVMVVEIVQEAVEEDKEIEELVGETVEGRVKHEAKEAERKIVEEKRREDIARDVFTGKREEFLSEGKERDLKPRMGIFSKLKGFLGADVQIGESETKELFDQLEMALLESDVSYMTAQALVHDLKGRLVGKRVKAGKIQEEVKKEIAFALASILQTSKSDFYSQIEMAKADGKLPFIVLFLGPNGMGKTTTIAKVAHNLKKRGLSSVISASDTFRAAAIEQSMHHGEKLGIKVIKHKYGADPAAVAFDAIHHAKAHKIDVVLIDTAGRQDTNLNLLAEMQKIVRVVKPDIKVFIAEAIAGTSLVNQVKAFNEKMGLDGIILTKLDCDAKGGGSLSIAYECKLPVYFVGTGQGYDDLLEFNENWIVKNIMAE
ncbi:MAG TPA: signal recognition particle-docking protein FtsY [Candidatus Norongarragalinales archaeon]|nr:signal recognition particle-docking protein FtsY [Candidatus Norongarragalinales archaeon]